MGANDVASCIYVCTPTGTTKVAMGAMQQLNDFKTTTGVECVYTYERAGGPDHCPKWTAHLRVGARNYWKISTSKSCAAEGAAECAIADITEYNFKENGVLAAAALFDNPKEVSDKAQAAKRDAAFDAAMVDLQKAFDTVMLQIHAMTDK